jgi:hypothetical protein
MRKTPATDIGKLWNGDNVTRKKGFSGFFQIIVFLSPL